jgi:hypothetical protein
VLRHCAYGKNIGAKRVAAKGTSSSRFHGNDFFVTLESSPSNEAT